MERDRSPVLRAGLSVSTVLVAAFFGVLVVWPLVRIGVTGFADTGMGRVVEILSRASLWRIVRFTLWQAVLSVMISIGIGVPLAHGLSRYRVPFAGFWRGLVTVPFVLPTLVVAGAIRGSGVAWVTDNALAAILWAHVFFNLAVVIKVVGTMIESIDQGQSDLARVLGCSPARAWRRVVLPQLAPAIAGAAMIVFLFCFTSYGVILILGGPAVATVETEIRRFAIFRNELDVAAVLTIVQLAFVVLVSTISARLRRSYEGRRRANSGRLELVGWRRWSGAGVMVAAVGAIIGWPMAAVIWRSVRVGNGFGFDNYRALAQPNRLLPVTAVHSMVTSSAFAGGASITALAVALLASFVIVKGGKAGRVFETLVLVPLGLSAVALGFGYIVTFTMFDLRRSSLLIPLAHAVIGVPFVMAALVPVWRSVSGREVEAARTLGANDRRVFSEIEWPRLSLAAWVGASFAFAISVGEFGATSFLSRGENTFTAPMAVFRLLGQPSSQPRGQAMALCVVLGVSVGLVTLVGDRLGASEPS